MKIFKHLRSEWFRYGFETLAVVIGILAAFALVHSEAEKEIYHQLIDSAMNLQASIRQILNG
jgi:hypothetical protein